MANRIDSPAQFGRVAVLMGGRSAEREISLKSGQAVLSALQRQDVDATGIDVGTDIARQLDDGQFDRVFNALHGRGGEDGEIQGLLQAIDLPFTGSDVTASVLSMNKRISKQNWQQQDLPTPAYATVNTTTDANELVAELGLPLIVKPVNEGSSIGMSKVTEPGQLEAAITLALEYDSDVIAEQWINGEEYTVAILGGEALPVIRLKTPNAFYDYAAKYEVNTTQYLCPCGLSDEDEWCCRQLAMAAFESLGMKGWGRIDVMRGMQDKFYLLEANSVPGMTIHSLVPMAASQAGLDFDALVWRVLETSFSGAA